MNRLEYTDLVKGRQFNFVTNGHAVSTRNIEIDFVLLMRSLSFMNAAGESGEPQPEPDIEFPVIIESHYSFRCGKCGKIPTVTLYEDRIEFEDNHIEPEAFSVDIEFPSGEMIFNDTYPSCFDTGNFDVNVVLGTQECSEFAAKQGLMHFFVGNSCPSVWKEGDTIYVGQLPEGEDDEAVGYICTDLWWASFTDPVIVTRRMINIHGLENAKSDATEAIKQMKSSGGSLKVTPGTYKCTSYYHLGGIDYGEDEKQIYCKLELIIPE